MIRYFLFHFYNPESNPSRECWIEDSDLGVALKRAESDPEVVLTVDVMTRFTPQQIRDFRPENGQRRPTLVKKNGRIRKMMLEAKASV